MQDLFEICFYIGVFWTVLSVFMSGMSGMGGGDVGDVGDAGDLGDLGDTGDLGDMGDVSAGHPGAPETFGHADHGGFAKVLSSILGYLSPTVIAIFMTVFGGVGWLCLLSGIGQFFVLLITIPSGLFAAILTRKFLTYVIRHGEKTSHPTNYDFIGQTAEVITPIPENGLGEIIMEVKKSRYNGPAKTEDGSSVAAKWYVKVKAIKNNTYIVQAMGPKEKETE